MKDFVIFANKPIQPGFSLNDLPGAGRIDLLARCVNTALWLSHGVRDDTAIHLYVEIMGQRAIISFFGGRIRRVSPDERNIGAWIKKSVECFIEGKERVQDGITVRGIELIDFLKEFKGRDIVVLREDGEDIDKVILNDPIFVLGDHLDLPDDITTKIKPDKTISLGPKSLLASHAIVLANNTVDKK